jgi:exodeoxyribonuclease V beta subunit
MGNVLQSEEMLELQLVLEAIASPRHDARVRAAMATHLWGSNATEVLHMSQAGSEAAWDAVLATLMELRDTWITHGFLQMTQELLVHRAVSERVLTYTDGDRRLTNLRHAVELLHSAAVADDLNIEGVLRWIGQQRVVRPEDAEIRELRLETDADAVKILTIHKSKGLQFDVVYCPTLYGSRPTDPGKPLLVHQNDQVIFDQGSAVRDERQRQAEVERLAEDCRLAYVALTRARFRTYVGWGAVGTTTGKVSGAWFSALAYLISDQADLDRVPTAERPAAVADWFKGDWTRYEAAVRALVQRHAAHMVMETVDAMVPPVRLSVAPPTEAPHYAARVLPDTVPLKTRFDTYTVTSFTGLTAGAHGISGGATRDVDDVRVNTTLSVQSLPVSDFRTFPAGRRAGTLLHTLFEHSRFDDTIELLHERVCARLLQEHMVAEASDLRIAAVAQMMHTVFRTPIAPWTFALAQLPAERGTHEWEFLLPFANAEQPFPRQAIAAAFEAHGGPDGARYAARLRQLGGARVHGFLTGFVDLVCEHEGKWYVIDWKSNQLGADPAAYGPDSLQAVLESSHYTLQYHLYLVALHRYLRTRVADYNIDAHLGGAAYAFLRGFSPGASVAGHGWFAHRPASALIEALSAIMDRGRSEAAP